MPMFWFKHVPQTKDPFLANYDQQTDVAWNRRGIWPAHWVHHPSLITSPDTPTVTAFRCAFTLTDPDTLTLHITADERYELYLDGRRIGRGSERGDINHWYFETYEISLPPGNHLLVARVWALGDQAPFAQMTAARGIPCRFLCTPQNPEHQILLATGKAPWEAKILQGYEFLDPSAAWGTGANLSINGTNYDWDFQHGAGDAWEPVAIAEEGSTRQRNDRPFTPLLTPATLPPMLGASEAANDASLAYWQKATVRLVTEPPPYFDLPSSSSGTRSKQSKALSSHTMGDLPPNFGKGYNLNGRWGDTCNIPLLQADNLPEEQVAWQQLLTGAPLIVPPDTTRRVLLDMNDYLCAYPELVTSGGANSLVRIHWQEALFHEPETKSKGNRDEIEGKYFTTIWHRTDGIGDTFLPDGGTDRRFSTLWWQCGRYVEILVRTEEAPLTIESLKFLETRYPLEMEASAPFEASDPRLAEAAPIMLRALQMCTHETYMDCPYYEQLMYIGDTRLQALTTYAITRDTRLPRKALQLFDHSRQLDGLTQSRYPTRVFQSIPPFSLWWVCMVYDFARWRDDVEFVSDLMPGVRGVIAHFLRMLDTDGLLHAPDGWNCFDWVPTWKDGTPPDGHFGISGPLTWQLVLALRYLTDLEVLVGEQENAVRARQMAGKIAARAAEAFWSEERGLFSDDLQHAHFSEHSQCLALLGGQLDPAQRDRIAANLLKDSDPNSHSDLARTTIYFSHYLFETYHLLGRTDLILKRMQLWFDLVAQGLKTTVEMPEPTRSDCHAWGAHPLYHYRASILGIRPASMGFKTVRIAPDLGPLEWVRGSLPHPKGDIQVDIQRTENGEGLTGYVILPQGVRGAFEALGMLQPLRSGRTEIQIHLKLTR